MITPLFAEISAFDPPILIASSLASLAFIFWLANLAMEFWRNIKDKPTGAEVMEKARKEFQPKGDYLTRDEFKAFKAELNIDLKSISDQNVTILEAGGKREAHLSKQMNDLQSQINGLPGKIVVDILNTKKLFAKND